MNLDTLSLSILLPALLAGMLVLLTHVPLGMKVLARGIVFIDLAIAQIATLGVMAADYFGFEPQGWGAQVAAVSAALLGAALLTWTEKRWPEIQEALIGALFVLAASGGMILVANNPHGGEHLQELLAGQILWVNTTQLIPVACLTAAILGFMLWRREGVGHFAFYALFAFAVTASVQLVGVYLVFASLIIPALASRNYAGRTRLFVAYGVGVAGYLIGLVASTLLDLPSGPVVVWTLALVGIVVHATKKATKHATKHSTEGAAVK